MTSESDKNRKAEEWVSAKDASKLLGCCIGHVHCLAQKGKLLSRWIIAGKKRKVLQISLPDAIRLKPQLGATRRIGPRRRAEEYVDRTHIQSLDEIAPAVIDMAIERFNKKVSKAANGCMVWTASVHDDGYGHFSIKYRNIRAHRFAFMVYRGPIPEGMFVCHSCDNPICVNPEHLWLGTAIENNKDKELKGRQAHGDRCRNTKLSLATALCIIKLRHHKRWPLIKIAKAIGSSLEATRAILLGETWGKRLSQIGVNCRMKEPKWLFNP